MADSDSKIDRSMPAARIAEKFGGVVAFAAAFDPPKAPSTCHRWLVSGLIPAKHQLAVMEAAKRKRIRLRPEEFIPHSAPQAQEPQAPLAAAG